MIKDADAMFKRWEEDLADLIPTMDLDIVLQKLKPEQRLAGLAPEQLRAALPPEHIVLALSDEALRAFSEDYLATLPADAQSQIRTRLGR